MSPVKVSGLFSITMDVVDGGGKSVPLLDSSTHRPRHVITVENISSLPRDVHAFASLPHGVRRIEFIGPSNSPLTHWDGQVLNIPQTAKRDIESDLRRNGGPAGHAEPIQCDEIRERRGGSSLAWNKLHQNLPFQITVDVG